MAIQFEDPTRVDIGSSRIRPRDVSQFQRGFGDNGAGDQMMQLAKSLEGLSGAFSALEQTRLQEQEAEIPLRVAQITAGFGSQATVNDINNITSDLHPKVRARVTEDYMSEQGSAWAAAELDRRLDANALMNPEQEQRVYQEVYQEAIAKYGSDKLAGAGFVKGVGSIVNQRQASLGASRAAEWQGIQRGAYRNDLLMKADEVVTGSLVPSLSSAIASTAQKYESPWMTAYLSRLSQVESSGGKNLVNPNSSARGPFQFIKSTGKSYGLMTEADRLDFAKSTDAAARLTMDNYAALSKALGREPTPGELYLAHQQGSGGAIRLLTSNARAVDVVGVDAVRLNGGNPNMSAQQFAALWTNKFEKAPGLTITPTSDPKVAYLPPEVQAMREYWFGKDTEYKVTSSLENAERRDIAANAFLQKAIQYRDERFLLALPDELMTPELRDQYAQARESINNLKIQDRKDQDYLKQREEEQIAEQINTDVLTRRANGETVNPYEYAIEADGSFNPAKFAAAQTAVANGGTFVSDVQSKATAASVRDKIKAAFLTKNFDNIEGLLYEGDAPSKAALRAYIMQRPDINDAEKLTLFASIEQDLGMVAFMQDPMVDKWFNTFVKPNIDNMMRAPGFNVLGNPNLEGQARAAYNLAIEQYLIANNGQPPIDTKPMFEAAVAAAEKVYMGANQPVDPNNRSNNAAPANRPTPPDIQSIFDIYNIGRQ